MARSYSVNITNGSGSENIANGSYSVSVTSTGYDESSINPSSIVVNDSTNSFDFTISASGSLTLHVTEDGTSGGVAVVGASFYRCDSNGITYGDAVTTDDTGNAVLPNLPYAESGAPVVYYKQVNSDSAHNFDDTLKNITLTQVATTVEVVNAQATVKTFNLTDANYSGLDIGTATLSVSE